MTNMYVNNFLTHPTYASLFFYEKLKPREGK